MFRQQIHEASPSQTLCQARLTEGLPDTVATALAQIAGTRGVRQGEVLFCQDQPPEGLYIVVSGSLELEISNSTKAMLLGVVLPCQVLGLSETISGRTYAATAMAREDSEVLFIARLEFVLLLQRFPELCLRSSLLLSRNVQQAYNIKVGLQSK
jgi:CRP-like cAMP-binding protein